MATTSRKPPRSTFAVAAVLLAAAALTGCAPKAPKGVNAKILDEAIANSIGDPTTCVLVVKKGSGEVVYRYGSEMTCGRPFPNCNQAGETNVDALAKAAAAGQERSASCGSPAGGVGFVYGPLPTTKPQFQNLAFAAAMNTQHMLPGVEIARRLGIAFEDAGF